MRVRDREPMCETSEKGERLIQRDEVLGHGLEIGRRLLEVFGYQRISNIVFRLRSNRTEIDAVINGEALPTTELLLGINKITGVSIDWLLTGVGPRYLPGRPIVEATGRRGEEEKRRRGDEEIRRFMAPIG